MPQEISESEADAGRDQRGHGQLPVGRDGHERRLPMVELHHAYRLGAHPAARSFAGRPVFQRGVFAAGFGKSFGTGQFLAPGTEAQADVAMASK